MGNRCVTDGSYACSERDAVAACNKKTELETSSPVDLSMCRFKCHFTEACGSYAWSTDVGACTLCAATAGQKQLVRTWQAPLQAQSGEARLMDWGVHHGQLLGFAAAEIDYISKGYIATDATLFTIKTTLVSGSVDHVEFKLRGNFCVRLPSVRDWSRDGKQPVRRFEFVWIIWIAGSLVLIALVSRVGSIRRFILFWKHRARVRCM